jgi:hypothetical protein
MNHTTLVWLKLGAAFVAFAAGVGAVVTAVALAHTTPSGSSTSSGPQAAAAPATPTTPAAAGTRFPTPPGGALVLARQDRDLAVGLAVLPGGLLQASLVGQDGPASGLSVLFGTGGTNPIPARACGPGCYRARVVGLQAARTVRVAIHGPNRPHSAASFALPASVRAPDAAALVRRAEHTWTSLQTLVVHDRLSSGPGNGITTLWRFAAPNRETYAIRNGPQAVVIGPRRWDRLPGQGWQASSQDPIRTPVPLWESVSDAHLLGTTTLRGRPVWKISFFDPQIQAWFTVWVDRHTARTLELRMTAQAHFMHQVYGPFDRPLRIAPPVKAAA